MGLATSGLKESIVKARFGLLLVLATAISIKTAASDGQSSTKNRQFTRVEPSSFRFLGASSCAASACHGNQSPPGTKGCEYTTWATQDKHARAYAVLLEKRSLFMMKALGRRDAHRDTLCLSCHVVPSFTETLARDPATFLQDGVSCESCHGPSQKWLTEHAQFSWTRRSSVEKQLLGMRDLRPLDNRISLCVDCHVGTAEVNVNHDLIAAGHPRLNFEFSAYHASWARHWPDAQDKDQAQGGHADFEARGWVLGQVQAAKAALDVICARSAAGRKPWLEFAELDCYACHHELNAKSRRDVGSNLRWNSWYFTELPQALAALENPDATEIAKTLNAIGRMIEEKRGSEEILSLAQDTAAQLVTLKSPPALNLQKLYVNILSDNLKHAAGTWDEATQAYLVLAALHNTWTDQNHFTQSKALRPLLVDLRQVLRFPQGFESPRYFDGSVVRKRLNAFQKILP
jgi:hypothetical protein